MPYDQDRGTRQIAWMKDVCQSQSTLAYLSNPPLTYPLPAVDIIGGLDNISTSLAESIPMSITSRFVSLDVIQIYLFRAGNVEPMLYTARTSTALTTVIFVMYLISSDSFRTRVDLVLSLSLKTALIYKSSMSYVSPQSLSSTQDLTSTNATNPRSIADVSALSDPSNVTFDFSAVISINDQDVKDLTQYDSGFQDLDAM